MDRRVIRTREALQRALMTLISERSYADIGVDDICRVAKVARSTFYTHYTGKDDLKRAGLETVAATFRREAGPIQPRLAFSLPMFVHARDHLRHYRAMKGGGSAVALATIREMVTRELRKEIAPGRTAAAERREFAIEFLAGAFMAVLTFWLERDASTAPEELDALFQDMSAGAISAL